MQETGYARHDAAVSGVAQDSGLFAQFTADQPTLRNVLGAQARAKRPDLPAGQVTQFSLLLTYTGKNGEDCGSESVSFGVTDLKNRTALNNLCAKDGPLPHAATTVLESVTVGEPDVTLPFRKGQTRTTEAQLDAKRIIPVAPE